MYKPGMIIQLRDSDKICYIYAIVIRIQQRSLYVLTKENKIFAWRNIYIGGDYDIIQHGFCNDCIVSMVCDVEMNIFKCYNKKQFDFLETEQPVRYKTLLENEKEYQENSFIGRLLNGFRCT